MKICIGVTSIPLIMYHSVLTLRLNPCSSCGVDISHHNFFSFWRLQHAPQTNLIRPPNQDLWWDGAHIYYYTMCHVMNMFIFIFILNSFANIVGTKCNVIVDIQCAYTRVHEDDMYVCVCVCVFVLVCVCVFNCVDYCWCQAYNKSFKHIMKRKFRQHPGATAVIKYSDPIIFHSHGHHQDQLTIIIYWNTPWM